MAASRLVRFATVDGALAAAECFPCRAECEGVHILVVARHRERVSAPYAGSGYHVTRERVICGVEIFDNHRRVRSLAAELAECYPREPMPASAPIAGGGLNAPLGPRPVPVEGW